MLATSDGSVLIGMGKGRISNLVMELAGLGDNVHLLPALWLVRRQWPEAKLHLMVNAHVASLFKLTPWVDRLWAYPSSPKPGPAGSLRWSSNLRAERFDPQRHRGDANGAGDELGQRATTVDVCFRGSHVSSPAPGSRWHATRATES